MKIDILTLFPEMFTPLKTSIIGRAVDSGKIELNIHDIRAYTLDKHKKCDDTPFGGGAGMVMMPQPIASAIDAIDPDHKSLRIFMSPKGKTFNQKTVLEYALKENILLLCGHYEGVDQRVLDLYIDEELSLGDFVLTGGEIPAMAVVDAVLGRGNNLLLPVKSLAASALGITYETANVIGAVAAIVIPVILLVACLFVYIRRRFL